MTRAEADSGPRANPAGAEASTGETPRGRALVLCADGTWNRGGAGRPTNVWRLHQAVDRFGGDQITIHDNGVGTGRGRLSKLFGGAFGVGLFRNVRDLYAFLIQHYRPGDRVFLFGFSRGAFTVRLLSGVIARCGILDLKRFRERGIAIDATKAARLALRSFRLSHEQVCREKQGRLAKLARWLRGADAEAAAHRMPIHLRDHFAHRSRQIEFIGVWDTVRAFGGPFDELLEGLDKLLCLTFADTKLAENVSYGAQALAIDEARRTFSPILWEEDARVTQVWFTGAHSDVGGGYEKQGLAAQTLHWMMDQVGDRLRFTEHALEEARAEANPHGGLHDSRSGTALFYRYLPREIRGGTIDESVFDRLRHGTGDYAPTNLGCADGTGVERASFADSTNAKIPVVARLRSTLHALTVAALSIGVIAVALFVKAEPASTDPSEGIVDAIISGATAISTHVSPFDALDGRIHGLAALARTHWQVSLAILFAVAALVGICWLLERKQVGMAKRHWVTVRDRESGRDDRS